MPRIAARLTLVTSLLCPLFVLGCGGGDLVLPRSGVPAHIEVVKGDDQVGPMGAALRDSLVVLVTDSAGEPLPGQQVEFVSEVPGAAVIPQTVTTSSDGTAGARWILGEQTGTQEVVARVMRGGTTTTLEVRFTASASAVGAAGLALRTQPSSSVESGVTFERQPVVQLRDPSGSELRSSGVAVTAAVASGGGTLGGTTTVLTDESGRAEFTDLRIAGDGPHVLIFAATGHTAVTSDVIDVRRAGGDTRSSSQTRIVADSPDPSPPGQAVRVEFTVTGNGGTPTGTVTVTVAGRPESCSASVTTGFCDLTLTAPDNSLDLTATYSGDDRFRGSSDTEKHRVEAAGDTRSSSQTRIVADSPDPSPPGQAVRVEFTVTGNGGTPTGTVTVTVAGRPESCSASAATGFCDLTLTAPDNSLDLTATYSGDDRFHGSSDTEKHKVVEAPRPNQAPIAADDEYEVLEGFEHILNVSARDGVLRNDHDPDGDPLTASDASDPSIGTVNLDPDGSFTYGPDPDAYGTDRFTYRVRDPAGRSSTGTVTIHVIPVNDSPRFILTRDHVESDASAQTIRGFANGISRGANGNEEHQGIQFIVSTNNDDLFAAGPAISDDGTLTYTPSGRTGTATVTVVLRDDGGTANNGNDTSQPQSFRITIQ